MVFVNRIPIGWRLASRLAVLGYWSQARLSIATAVVSAWVVGSTIASSNNYVNPVVA